MTPELASICDQLGVRVVPNERSRTRGPGETCAKKTISRIFEENGPGHTTLVLRTFVETENNAGEIVGPMLHAVSEVIQENPAWTATTKWFDAFDGANLSGIWSRAKSIERVPRRFSAKTILTEHLRAVFSPDAQQRGDVA